MILLALPLAATSRPARAEVTGSAPGNWVEVLHSANISLIAQLTEDQCTIVVNDCEACFYGENGQVTCSAQGFACTASNWTCMKFDPSHKD